MTRHRWAIAIESVVLAGPTTAFFLLFGPLVALVGVKDSTALSLAFCLVVVLSAVALFYFWRLAFAFTLGAGLANRRWWWGALIGVALVAAAALLVMSSALGLAYPEFLIPLAFGTYGAPLLVPLLHMWLVRGAFAAVASPT